MHFSLAQAGTFAVWWLLCTGTLCLLAAAGSDHVKGRCKPQGLLLLDQPYPSPRRVELPFCQQYGCSCCNASHALAIQRAARQVAEDEDLSQECKRGLLRLSCRVCDPQVGTGSKARVCSDTCQGLFDACAQDFFAYEASNGLISPCSESNSAMLVCSQLTDLVSSAAEFCKAAGFGRMAAGSSADEPCFDGSPVGAEACPAEPPASTQHTQQQQQKQQQQQQKQQQARRRRAKRGSEARDPVSRLLSMLPWKVRRRHRQQLAVAAELLFGLMLSSFMAWAVVKVLQRVMQPTRHRRRHAGPPPANVREVLARAAEVRSRSTVAPGGASKKS